MNFQPDDVANVLELDTEIGLEDESESNTAIKPFESVKLGGNIMWSDPVMTEPTRNGVRLGRVIWLPDRLTYTPTVKLRYLGEMAELEQSEQLTVVYMSIKSMELSLVGAGVGGGIKHTRELRVLNFKKAMHSPDTNE